MPRTLKGTFLLIIVAAGFALLLGAREMVNFTADWLFFRETGFEQVFLKTFSAEIATGLAFALLAFLILFINLRIAVGRRFSAADAGLLRGRIPALEHVDLNTFMRRIAAVVATMGAIIAFVAGTLRGTQALMAFSSVAAGKVDPIFGIDLSFYVFPYPLLDSLNNAVRGLLGLAALLCGLVYAVRGGVMLLDRAVVPDPAVKRHLGVLVALFLLSLAVTLYLDRFALLTTEHGVLFGASYTDLHARLFMLSVLAGLAAVAAVIVAVTAFGRSLVLPLIAIALFAGLAFIGLQAYPSMVQSFKVSPNELVLERPYILNHIALTRFGYGLESLETRTFGTGGTLTMADIRKNISTVRNIRLWDEGPLLKTYSQLQQIRTYYRFGDVDNDRYRIGDAYLQVMLSPRELSYADLPNKSWINERLVFTHGFGLAMGPVSGITKEGLPEFFIKDIPPVTSAGPVVTRPEIYYGEHPNDYVIVGTKQKEFGYPTEDANVYSTYTGEGGVRLSSFSMRLLYAAYFGNLKLVLSSDITNDSRILYNRSVIRRVSAIAPFLSYDPDPYLMIRDNGRLVWIIDAYSTTGRLPYSKPAQPGVNYIRNPAKITVDAYDGTVTFYLVDPGDMLSRTYQAAFPALFKPFADMPPDIRRHIRYPRALLSIQARMFSAFHMTDPAVFYNKEDLWEIPSSGSRSMDPYYLITKLPEEGRSEEYVLLLPFTPARRDNLAAWMAARCDGDEYGKVVVYTFPRDRLVFGPRQIDARIDQDAYISQQLTLWGQHGSEVIRGSLLIIPIERSLLYVQPLYLVATDQVGLPELRRVIAAYGSTVVMEENLETAIQRLFSGVLPRLQAAEQPGTQPQKLRPQELGKLALERLRKAREALRKEDWSGFGKHLQEAEDALKEMTK